MMALLPALTSSLLSGLVLWGSSTCPSPREVDGRLTAYLPLGATEDLQVELIDRGTAQLVLRDRDSRVIAAHALSSPATCDLLAEEAASTIAAWISDLSASPPPRPESLRQPMQARPNAENSRDRRFELGVSGGIRSGTQLQQVTFAGVTELQWSPPGNGVTVCAALGLDGAHPVRGATGLVGSGWHLAFGPGGGLRARVGILVVDVFALLPVSLVVPMTVESNSRSPLSGALEAAVMLGVQGGLRVTGWDRRFAPFLRLAVDATLMSSGQLAVLPVALSLGLGIAWSST